MVIKIIMIDSFIAGGKSTFIQTLNRRFPHFKIINEGVSADNPNPIISLTKPEDQEFNEEYFQSKIVADYERKLLKAIRMAILY